MKKYKSKKLLKNPLDLSIGGSFFYKESKKTKLKTKKESNQ